MSIKIAIVDDSPVVLEWVKSACKSAGYEVVSYNRSLGVQSFLSKEKPTLLLLDVTMPALNGNMVCRMLKQNPATRDILVILYSSRSEEELEQMVGECGADGHIRKGKDSENLKTLIRMHLEKVR